MASGNGGNTLARSQSLYFKNNMLNCNNNSTMCSCPTCFVFSGTFFQWSLFCHRRKFPLSFNGATFILYCLKYFKIVLVPFVYIQPCSKPVMGFQCCSNATLVLTIQMWRRLHFSTYCSALESQHVQARIHCKQNSG